MATSATPKLTIAVTGGIGDIGRGILNHALAEGHTVVAIDHVSPDVAHGKLALHERLTYVQAELSDFDAFKNAVAGCNALIHLAAVYSLQDPKDPDGPLLRDVPEHVIHNTNTSLSWNALDVAVALGIKRVALASSVNAVGLIFSKHPRLDYLPLDEAHPCYPEDAYSFCKVVVEGQAATFARKYGDMRIATIRPHWVVSDELGNDPVKLDAIGGAVKDLWGWVTNASLARMFLLSLTVPETQFPLGHESFFAVSPNICQQRRSLDLLAKHFPEVKDIRKEYRGNEGFYDCSKAARLLGWTEKGYEWFPEGGNK